MPENVEAKPSSARWEGGKNQVAPQEWLDSNCDWSEFFKRFLQTSRQNSEFNRARLIGRPYLK